MKYYVKNRFSYDWLKYLAIMAVCLFFWSSVFSVINNYAAEEKINVFLCAYETVPGGKLTQMHQTMTQQGIAQINFACYDHGSDKYPTVLAVKGIHGSDVLILDEAGMKLYLAGGNALALTEEVLADLLCDDRQVQIEYVDDRPAAIKIYDSDDPSYNAQFDLSFLELGEGRYYLVINGRTVHAEPYAQGATGAVIDLCRMILSE